MSATHSKPFFPGGRTEGLAMSVSVMLEGWAESGAPGIGPMGNPLKAGVFDFQARSWADYGPKAGVWRLLDILAACGTKAVFYVSGVIAERNPEVLKAIAEAGHGVAAHSWTQDMIPAYLTREQEAKDIARCTQALEAASGSRPVGWLSPRCTPSADTATLIAEAGYAWHADIFDADVPYRLDTPAGPLAAVPFTMEINDMPLYIRYGNEPQAYTHILQRLLDEWTLLPTTAACLDLTVHAHVFGRPAGAIEFAKSLKLVQARADVAVLTHHDELTRLFEAGTGR